MRECVAGEHHKCSYVWCAFNIQMTTPWFWWWCWCWCWIELSWYFSTREIRGLIKCRNTHTFNVISFRLVYYRGERTCKNQFNYFYTLFFFFSFLWLFYFLYHFAIHVFEHFTIIYPVSIWKSLDEKQIDNITIYNQKRIVSLKI